MRFRAVTTVHVMRYILDKLGPITKKQMASLLRLSDDFGLDLFGQVITYDTYPPAPNNQTGELAQALMDSNIEKISDEEKQCFDLFIKCSENGVLSATSNIAKLEMLSKTDKRAIDIALQFV